MAKSIKGIIVEIGGDTSGLQKALSKVNSTTTNLSKELKGINSLLKLDPKNTELLAQKQTVLNQNIKETTEKLKQLKQVQQEADKTIKNGGTISQENYRNLQREIINTENKLKELKTEASNWTKVSKALDNISAKMKSLGDKISSVGQTLTTSLTIPIAGVTAAAISIGNTFEKQMSRVQGIAGATTDELKKLNDQAIELGAKTSFSATEAAEGMENLASAGFNAEEIMKAMPGLLDLAASSGAELAIASEITASALRGFGLDANQAVHVADVFAEAAARTNAQTEDMGEAMKYIAPVANTMGLSLEETAAAIGIMSDAGIKGSQAGTSLRGALTRLTKPTDKMEGVMRRLGIEFYDNKGKMKSLSEMVKMLSEKTKGLTDEEKQNALTILFGTESLSGMLSLINRGSDELSNMTENFKNADGAAKEMAETMLNNTSGAIEEMKGAFESIGITVQQILAPFLTKIANKIQELATKFLNLPESTQKTILAIAGIVAAIGPVLIIIGKLITAVSTITGLFSGATAAAGGATAATGALSGAMTALTGPVGIVIAAVAALVAGFIYLFNTNEDFKNKVLEIWNSVVDLFNNTLLPAFNRIKDAVVISLQVIWEIWQKLWSKLEPLVLQMLNWLTDFWNNTLKGIIENIVSFVTQLFELWAQIYNNFIGPFVSALIEYLWPTVEKVFNSVWSTISGVFESIGGVIKAVTGILDGLITFISGVFTGDWKKAWEGVTKIFSNLMEGLWSIIKTPLNWIIDGINNLIGGLNGLKIPDWVPGVGGKGINIPKIPKLAKGGIVDKATLAMIGEGKSAEAVIPLDRTLTKYMAEAMRQAGGTGQVTVNFYPQHMTEAEMDRAFNYIDRKYGFAF